MVWFREVEYMRGFAPLAVVAVHISMNYTRIPAVNLLALVNVFIYVAAHFAVPVFVFISGWVLAARYSGDYPLRGFYRRRARTILLPYLFFTALYLMVTVEGTIGFAGVPSPEMAAEALLLGTAAYHLWFFVLIIQLYLLFPLIMRGYDRFDRSGAALFLLLALLFVQILWNAGAHLAGAFAGTEWYTVLIRLFPSHLLYFVLGIHAARYTDGCRSALCSLPAAWILAAAGAGALLIGGIWAATVLRYGSISGATLAVFCIYRILEPFYYVPVIAALVLAAWRLDERGGRRAAASRLFGEHSYGIYLVHPLVIAAGAAAWTSLTGLSWADWETYPVIFAAAAVVSYGAVRHLSRVPYAGWLLGEPRVRRRPGRSGGT
ncbi:acyltransferase [Methanoculleus sp. FWC-SCC3]|uniref:Acyltransferase n=1 Tax=Methanoculleus methanifontis TaxID=2584086 RepID=A0ABT8LY24_9EURY|nr:acyltransferase [Methanoculleus sp. FWC-SCC3]MDN7011682.1 acyltransferase [Methanoculleus sp. FWC-SCC3]